MTLIYLAGSWLLGLYLASRGDAPGILAAGTVLLLVVLAFALRSHARCASCCLLVAALAAGWLRYDAERVRLSPGPLSTYNGGPTLALRGVVINDPTPQDRWTNLRVDVDAVERNGQWATTSDLVQVQVPSYDEHLYGEWVQITGRLESPPDWMGSGYKDYLARQGIHSIQRFGEVRVLGENHGHVLWAWLYAVKKQTRANLWHLLPEPQASLLTGILLGSDEGIPQNLVDDMRTTGTAHIIAISGFNIAVVSAALAAVLLRVCRRYVALVVTFSVILLYAVLVGAEAPVMRATIMGALGALAVILGRRAHGLTSLAVAAWCLTLWDPFALWDAGYQLSFLAAWGLVSFSDRLSASLDGVLVSRRWGQVLGSWAHWLLGPLILTAAAQLTTLPWMLRVFGQVSFVSVLINVLVLPVQPMVVYVGGMAALVSHMCMPVARLLGFVAWFPLTFTIRVVHAFVPLAQHASWTPNVPDWVVLAYYASLVLLSLRWATTRSQPSTSAPLARAGISRAVRAGLVAAMALVVWNGARPAGSSLRVTFLDVGQGDAILVQTPAGRVVLVDGGPSPVALQAALGRHLPPWKHALDLVVLTHSHDDHIRGLLDLSAHFEVRQIITGVSERPSQALQRLYASGPAVLTTDQPWSISLDSGVQLLVLPCSGQGVSEEVGLVTKLSWGQASFLLTGDAEAVALERLVKDGWLLQSMVLKVPHHGSNEALSDSLLDSIQPAVAVVSVGSDNGFGHPAVDTLQALRGRNIALLRTDDNGDIQIIASADQLNVVTQRDIGR
jgi:competence protein ComEC